MLKFERRRQKVAPVHVFVRRVSIAIGLGLGMIGIALAIGVVGYHELAGLNWIDSLLEASMILGGMGPISTLQTDGAKLFASAYALFSGLVLIGVMGVIFTPVVHRVLHRFHAEAEEK